MKFINRDGKITLDGQFDLTVVRRDDKDAAAIHMDRDDDALPCLVTGFNVLFLNQKTRLGRFWTLVKTAWQYSK